MDLGTILGVLMGLTCVVAAIFLHGSATDFVDLPGALVAFGGSFSALFISFPARKVLGVFDVVKNCFHHRLPDPRQEIRRLAELAVIARRDGLLALEDRLGEIDDPFLVRGLELVIDSTPRARIEEILHTELSCIEERHATGKKLFEQLGASLPAFGMVGTLIGLIEMLHTLDDPSRIGSGMAVALVTTFYGALAANLICLPLANKLEARGRDETLLRELMISGLLAISAGETSRTLESKLKIYLEPRDRRPEAPAA